MARTLCAAALAALQQREGCKLVAYQDSGGVWTIGYGDTHDVTVGMTITQAEADARLATELSPVCDCVESSVTVPLTDNQFGALVSFVYNIGAAAFQSSTLLKKLNASDYESVPAQMLRWVNVNGVRNQGLVNRRNSEGGQWVRGAMVSSASITPDAPPSIWKIPRIGAAISGVTGTALTTAAAQAQSAASAWHPFQIVFIVLSALAVGFIIFKREDA